MAVTHVLVGLGNPGLRYRNTRHNIGFRVLDALSTTTNSIAKTKTKYSRRVEVRVNNEQSLVLARPTTYMNRSGMAVAELVAEYHIPLSNMLIILDDFNLPFGRIRFRSKGSAGGHNGLKSIIEYLQDSAFPRLRLGIGQEFATNAVDFVLGKFTRLEKRTLPEIVRLSAEACLFFVENGITKTMNKYN